MYLSSILATLISVASLTRFVAADLRITADKHSFGGVNVPSLQYHEPDKRDELIRAIVKSGARVIRLIIRGDKKNDITDPEPEVGNFDREKLDQFDDTLAAIHRISKGKVKVIIAPHDAHALRETNDAPCDAYCQRLEGAFLDFYSNEEVQKHYKARLNVFFMHYPSKNFGGRSWATLNEVILGVDVQNQPFASIWPIPAGEAWLCDMATHMKEELQMGKNNIAVISGGVSGLQSADGIQNFPESVWKCPAIDVIGIHGRFEKDDYVTSGTPWANLFVPGNTLTARAEKEKKLILVEEWEYVNTKFGLHYKKEAIFDQANALNYRGIPWLYSYITSSAEGTTSAINPLRDVDAAIGGLQDVLSRANKARSNFNWSPYIPAPSSGLTNLTIAPLNPYTPSQSDCTLGCEGHLCDAADGCTPDLICKNSVCQRNSEKQPGKIGDDCNSKQVCQEHLACEDKICQACSIRPSLPPVNKGRKKYMSPNDINGQCNVDSALPFRMRAYCKLPPPKSSPARRGNPCENASHCDANEFCDWGLCKVCTSKDSCLGATCKNNNVCKTGFCNNHGRCDYPGQKKIATGPGARAQSRNKKVPGAPKGFDEKGPNRVRDEAMRINIPEEQAQETGAA